MGHKGRVLRPRCIGPGRTGTRLLFYSMLTSLIIVGGTDYRDAGRGACSAMEGNCERTEQSRGASTKKLYSSFGVVRELTTAHGLRVTNSKTSLIRTNGWKRRPE